MLRAAGPDPHCAYAAAEDVGIPVGVTLNSAEHIYPQVAATIYL